MGYMPLDNRVGNVISELLSVVKWIPTGMSLWRWRPSGHNGQWVRFDAFASAALEARLCGKTGPPLVFPIGTVALVDPTARTMVILVDGEEIGLDLLRCAGSVK